MKLLAGDVFATKNPNGLGRAICLAQKVKSPDGKAEYGHTGIIQTPDGKTLEAVWKIAEQNLFEAYKGNKVLVARLKNNDVKGLKSGLQKVLPLRDRIYPAHRLFLHAIGLARWIHFLKTPVCSELTAMFLVACGVPMSFDDNYWGITPDNLVDEWRISKHFDIIFEGILDGTIRA